MWINTWTCSQEQCLKFVHDEQTQFVQNGKDTWLSFRCFHLSIWAGRWAPMEGREEEKKWGELLLWSSNELIPQNLRFLPKLFQIHILKFINTSATFPTLTKFLSRMTSRGNDFHVLVHILWKEKKSHPTSQPLVASFPCNLRFLWLLTHLRREK